MITLEDILEELVGDIQDEYDRLPVHVTKAGWAWVVGGGIGLQRLNEQQRDRPGGRSGPSKRRRRACGT